MHYALIFLITVFVLVGCSKEDEYSPMIKVIAHPTQDRIMEVYSFIYIDGKEVKHGEHLDFSSSTQYKATLFNQGELVEGYRRNWKIERNNKTLPQSVFRDDKGIID